MGWKKFLTVCVEGMPVDIGELCQLEFYDTRLPGNQVELFISAVFALLLEHCWNTGVLLILLMLLWKVLIALLLVGNGPS